MNELQQNHLIRLLDVEQAVINLLSNRAAVMQGAKSADEDAMDYWMDELERLTT